MRTSLKTALLVIFSLLAAINLQAQMDSTLMLCKSKMQLPYISDGQSYTAFLNGDETAEFSVTFYGESKYRIVGYLGNQEGNLVFNVFDQERNLLFSNQDFQNAPYWDFEFDYTLDCIIEARIDNKNLSSGIAVLLIGFEQ